MTRTLKVLIALSVVVVLAFVFAGSTGASVEPQLMRVTLKDYQINLSQFVVTPSKAVSLVIDNEGELTHQLVIHPYSDASQTVLTSPVIGSHTIQTVNVTLAPGIYRIECVQLDHVNHGMVSVIAADSPHPTSIPIQMDFIIPVLGLVLGSAYIIADSIGLRLTKS